MIEIQLSFSQAGVGGGTSTPGASSSPLASGSPATGASGSPAAGASGSPASSGSPLASGSPATGATSSPAASGSTGGGANSTLNATIDVLPRSETATLGTGNQLGVSIETATVNLTVNGAAVTTDGAAFDGFVSPNFKGGYLSNGNVTINFLCPDMNGGGGSTTGTPTASPSGSPASSTEPSGSPASSSSP